MARVFTLEEARELMPKVKALTHPAFELAASLAQELQAVEDKDEEARCDELRARLHELINSWTEGVRELGPDVKGLWLVDFDSGDGYWSWSYPEEELTFWHNYEEGYTARVSLEERPRPKCKK